MPFIAAGFGQATLEFEIPGPGTPAMVTFGFDRNDARTPDAEATSIRTAWTTTGSMHASIDTNATLVETRVLVRTAAGVLLSGVDPTTVPGLNSGTAAPPQVALLYQKRSGLAGKNRRGRMYVPAVPSVGETGVWTAGQLTSFNARAAVFLGALTTEGVPMYLLHTNPADPPNAITELIASSIAATQRRRIR